jgi:hypothetical protein
MIDCYDMPCSSKLFFIGFLETNDGETCFNLLKQQYLYFFYLIICMFNWIHRRGNDGQGCYCVTFVYSASSSTKTQYNLLAHLKNGYSLINWLYTFLTCSAVWYI